MTIEEMPPEGNHDEEQEGIAPIIPINSAATAARDAADAVAKGLRPADVLPEAIDLTFDMVDVFAKGIYACLNEAGQQLRSAGWEATSPFKFTTLIPEPIADEVVVRVQNYVERTTAGLFAQTGRRPNVTFESDPAFQGDDDNFIVPLQRISWSWTFGPEFPV